MQTPGRGVSLRLVSTSPTHRTIEAVWRMESPRLIGALVRMLGDVGLAEEAAQDALVAALERWPQSGLPDNPAAWLMTTAKNRAIDVLRRARRVDEKNTLLGHEQDLRQQLAAPDPEAALDNNVVGDDLLRLVLIACHPVLPTDARVALTLRLLGGLTTAEIARAYLVPEPTVAQRIVRAKRTLAQQPVAFEVPRGAELEARVPSVLEVVYLIFNEGYSATAGQDWMRPALCEDALRLGRVLAGLLPTQAEVHGLLALMEIQASRAAARMAPNGAVVPLLEQNRARWDHVLIRRGLQALDRALALNALPGVYTLQAAIAACHARARTPQQTDWEAIVAYYTALLAAMPSPVVELNRAVAVSMARGPAAGLELVNALQNVPALKTYHLLPSVRGDLLFKLGQLKEARVEFERAAALTQNQAERDFLLARAVACAKQP